MSKLRIFTVGHSTHPLEKLVGLLQQHGVTALADVRSTPFSRFNPQFNKPALKQGLEASGIRYVFLGRELGARPQDQSCYEDGKVRFHWLRETALFKSGITRLMRGLDTHTVAMMCAEKDPTNCHRTMLVAPALAALGVEISHILADGNIEPHEATMSRIPTPAAEPQEDLFDGKEQAYLSGKAQDTD